MIFLGDVAHPFNVPPSVPIVRWEKQPAIANLEGGLIDCCEGLSKRSVLFNDPSIIKYFEDLDVKAVCLANNHIFDMVDGLFQTQSNLEVNGIKFFGAGIALPLASEPACLKDNGKEFVVLGFGWSVIQCKLASECTPGVNPYNPFHILDCVKRHRELKPDAILVVMPHWNYELELYPQPAHRQLAIAAIEAGADAVIGHHSHCVGGIEIYKNKPIVYSLGNWWLPQGVFYNGKVSYPELTFTQLALEWDGAEKIVCHWYQYERSSHTLNYKYSELVEESNRIKELTPFSGFSQDEYIKWFKENRVKKRFLPIYKDYRHTVRNGLRDIFVAFRHPMMLVLKKMLSIRLLP
ncbi:CapA family protein [Stutzerimonas nitrititolerans]|uniref:CapA family protein n=1 Tax=Stutzerimonas nitrititolerans TaxID=2482751 RepID=UPI0028B19795|nr:CapA family protein [Stutzerimonas nitrititolerans]